nr:hypothetical protein CFP56_57577 [Quercus suber]
MLSTRISCDLSAGALVVGVNCKKHHVPQIGRFGCTRYTSSTMSQDSSQGPVTEVVNKWIIEKRPFQASFRRVTSKEVEDQISLHIFAFRYLGQDAPIM